MEMTAALVETETIGSGVHMAQSAVSGANLVFDPPPMPPAVHPLEGADHGSDRVRNGALRHMDPRSDGLEFN